MDTTETNNAEIEEVIKKKKTPLLLIILVVVIIAAVAAYFMLGKSTKQKYFTAEKNSFNQVTEYLENRYEPEIKWQKSSLEQPSEVDLNISAEMTDDYGYLDYDTLDLINNSELNIHMATDFGKKIAKASIAANVGPFEISDLDIGLTADELTIKLPFLPEVWVISDSGLYDLIVEADPYLAEGFDKEDFNFGRFFETSEILDQKDIKYVEKEYVHYIYKLLDDKSFKASKDKIEVNGEKFNAEVIEMNISEDQVKKIMKEVAKKAKDDKRLQEIIYEQVFLNMFGSSFVAIDQIEIEAEFKSEFKNAMDEVIDNVDDEIDLPEGIVSKIWTHKNAVVQREINIAVGGDYPSTLNITGEQLISKAGIYADYTMELNDEYDEILLSLDVDSTWEKNQAEDKVLLSFSDGYDDFEVIYTGDETLNKGTRDFKRKLAVEDNYYEYEMFNFIWSGNATYDSKKATSENEFAISVPDFFETPLKLHVNQEARQVKSVDKPDTKNAVKFDDMTIDEIEMYFFDEVEPLIMQEFGF